MKFTKYLLSIVLVFFLGFLIFCGGEEDKTEWEQTREEILSKMTLDEGMIEEEHIKKKKTLADQIFWDHHNLRIHFKKGEFGKMAQIYGEASFIVTPKYKSIQGSRNISAYWRTMKDRAEKMVKEEEKEGELDVKFETIHVFLTDVLGESEVVVKTPDKEEIKKYDCSSYEVLKVSIFKKVEDGTFQIIEFNDLVWRPHLIDCPWERMF